MLTAPQIIQRNMRHLRSQRALDWRVWFQGWYDWLARFFRPAAVKPPPTLTDRLRAFVRDSHRPFYRSFVKWTTEYDESPTSGYDIFTLCSHSHYIDDAPVEPHMRTPSTNLAFYNAAIEPWMLNRDLFTETMKKMQLQTASGNATEFLWKGRQLHTYTPVGGVVMYFDPFKGGFGYYADSALQYDLLTALAMRYVLQFRCRDLFWDAMPGLRPADAVEGSHEMIYKNYRDVDIKLEEEELCEYRALGLGSEPDDGTLETMRSEQNPWRPHGGGEFVALGGCAEPAGVVVTLPKIDPKLLVKRAERDRTAKEADALRRNRFFHAGKFRDFNPLQSEIYQQVIDARRPPVQTELSYADFKNSDAPKLSWEVLESA